MPRLLTSTRLRPGLVAVALAVPVITSACGSSAGSGASSPSAAPSATAAGPTASATGPGGATAVTVTETEFSLHLSQTTFTPGSYTFTAKDTGHVSHALALSGPGVPTTQTATIGPGGSAELTVTLQKGEYELWCPVDGHRSLGMDTHIQVS